MTEGMEELSAGPVPSPGSTSPTSSAIDTGQVPEEKPEETEAAGESGEEGAGGTAEGSAAGDGEHLGALGIVALPGTCCVCIEMEHVNSCLHSEKICILPILACLLSLALCTAGLKWVFVDRIFEYEPPTHLDPKPIGQDPIIISVDPTQGLTVSVHRSSTVSLTTAITITIGHPDAASETEPTRRPTLSDPSVTLRYNAVRTTDPKQAPKPQPTQESNDIIVPTTSATSSTTSAKTSSHVTRCSDSQRNYCVNGGECFTLEIMPGSTKFLCRCPNEFTGDRCQSYVMASFYKAEELYQKRILTITGICIALLVVGIMCVVAYCKTKKQRKTLHDRLRQRLKNKRKSKHSARGRPVSNLPLQDLQPNNQCNGKEVQAAAETDAEVTTTKFASSAHEPSTLTHSSSQRFVSACQTSPATPGSPPSEMSAPLSSLAVSEPSVALSPSGEEARPLLLSKKSSSQDEQKRMSAHYNHGHVAHSLPPSPLFIMEHMNTGDGGTDAARHLVPASPGKQNKANNNINHSSVTAGVSNGCLLRHVESSCDGVFEAPSERSTTGLLRRDSRRTKPAAVRPSAPHAQQGPLAAECDARY